MRKGYYYLHINGQLIFKPDIVVESDPYYFYSPLVRKVWKIENEDQYKEMIQEVERTTEKEWLLQDRARREKAANSNK